MTEIIIISLVMTFVGFLLGCMFGGLFIADKCKRPPKKDIKGKVILTLQDVSDRFGIPLEDIYIKDIDGRLRDIERYVNVNLTYGKSGYQIYQELKELLK